MALYWHIDRHVEQWNKIEDAETHSHSYVTKMLITCPEKYIHSTMESGKAGTTVLKQPQDSQLENPPLSQIYFSETKTALKRIFVCFLLE